MEKRHSKRMMQKVFLGGWITSAEKGELEKKKPKLATKTTLTLTLSHGPRRGRKDSECGWWWGFRK